MAVLDRDITRVGMSLDTEIRFVAEAVALVASGRSRRVVVAGLHDDPAVLRQARRSAARAGLALIPIPGACDGLIDLAVELPLAA
jgi:hypothetical protein